MSFCLQDYIEFLSRQLNLLDKISKSHDPWKDKNLFKFITTNRPSNGNKFLKLKF